METQLTRAIADLPPANRQTHGATVPPHILDNSEKTGQGLLEMAEFRLQARFLKSPRSSR
jgi:hypothetical protein